MTVATNVVPIDRRPTALEVIPENIPTVLKEKRRWVVWKYEQRDGDWTKVPYIASTPTNHRANTTDAATWRPFAQALATYRTGKVDGIGFVLGDGYIGFDADKLELSEQQGLQRIDVLTRQYVTLLNSYTEWSPSGRGLHCLLHGEKPTDSKCKNGKYELYDHGRFFTVTGHRLAELPGTVEARTPEIAKLAGFIFPDEAPTARRDVPTGDQGVLDDEEVITRASNAAKKDLFVQLFSRGEWRGVYPSQSEADASLCNMLAFWTQRHPTQMDRLFRKSRLMRSKWDERRGAMTYGQGTIDKAVQWVTEVYTPERTRIVIEDFHAFMERIESQPAQHWLVQGLVPDEGICLWHGQPRDFKSMSALHVALALTCGYDAFASPRFGVARAVKVAYFTEEDPERLFAARMHWLTAKNPRPGRDSFFPFVRKSVNFDVEADRELILGAISQVQAQVVFFDPMRSFTGLSDKGPADLRPVAQFLRCIQNTTTAKTIVLVHHDTKPLAVVSEGQERSRSQQASGGGIFSLCDCPVSFKKVDWNRVAVFPEDYKLSGDPKPFEVTFATDARQGENGLQFGTWITPVAITKNEEDIAAGVAAKKILTFLRSRRGEWFSTLEVNDGAHLRKDTAGGVLKKLLAEDVVKSCTGDAAVALGRSKKANLWSVAEPEPRQAELAQDDDL